MTLIYLYIEEKDIMEKWKDIKGYEGLYQASTFGRIKHVKNNYITYGSTSKGSYLRKTLCKNSNKRYYLVHRLIAETFIDNYENKLTVNHIDGDRTNNSVTNLEWATYQEQELHKIYELNNGKCLTGNPISLICQETGEFFNSVSQCSKNMNLSAMSIWRYLDSGKKFKGYTFNKMSIEDKKKKSKLTITIHPDILQKLDDNCTNKSVYIEYAILNYMKRNNINIDDIIL